MIDIQPPKYARQFLRWFCHPDFSEELEGDLLEHFHLDIEAKGLSYARKRYRREVLKLFRPSVIKNLRFEFLSQISSAMLQNYFKIAIRSLWKYKTNSLINILGLTMGLTGCLLIGLFVKDELLFDRHHPDQEQLYRVYANSFGSMGNDMNLASSSPMLGPTLKDRFAEVIDYFRLYPIRQKLLFKNEDRSFLEENGHFAEPSILTLFDLPMLYGDPSTALDEPSTIVLTQELATKYFGLENPVGKELSISGKPTRVTGVLEKLSPHFHLDFHFLISFPTLLYQVSEERMQSWVWQDFFNYIKVVPGTDQAQLEAKLVDLAKEKIYPQTEELEFYYNPKLQNVADIHLHSVGFRSDIAIRGNYRYLVGLALVGLFLLLIACINFINLTTARAVRRAKEVGVRKAAGAVRSQLASQFLGEAVLVAMISTVLACILAWTILPYLNDFTGKNLSFGWLAHPARLTPILGLCLITGFLAGAYPAFIISGFNPMEALKSGHFRAAGHGQWFRKGLVVVQFSLSILLIISVLIISRQINHLTKKDLGFHQEQLLHFPMKGKLFRNPEAAKDEFRKIPAVQSITACFGIPGDIIAGDNIIVPGENRRNISTRLFNVDHDYIQTMGMTVIAGRDFSRDISTDPTSAFIINETALSSLDLGKTPDEALGKPLEWPIWSDKDTLKKGRVIGVVKDFHFASLHQEIQTAVLQIHPDSYWKMAISLKTDNMPETISAIEKTWDSFETGYPLDYQFIDAGFGAMYEAEEKWSTLLHIFTFLAIFIACIGAMGLAAYTAEQRKKEIGIRKVLGASTSGIVGLLSRDFLKLIVISLLIAIPLGWYFMHNWLNGFAYRVNMPWWTFLLAAAGILLLAFLTVGSQSLRAAMGNPVNSLRTE